MQILSYAHSCSPNLFALNMADAENLEMWSVVPVNGVPGANDLGEQYKATNKPHNFLRLNGGLEA